VNGLHESVPVPTVFPADLVERVHAQGVRRVAGLRDALLACYSRALLPAEAGMPWARAGRLVDLAGYRSYPSAPGLPAPTQVNRDHDELP